MLIMVKHSGIGKIAVAAAATTGIITNEILHLSNAM